MNSPERYRRLTRLYEVRATVAAGDVARASRALSEAQASHQAARERVLEAQRAIGVASAPAGCITQTQLQAQRRRIAVHLAQRAEAQLDVQNAGEQEVLAQDDAARSRQAHARVQRKLDKWQRVARDARRKLERRLERLQAATIEEDAVCNATR